jgi:hypothetical protein
MFVYQRVNGKKVDQFCMIDFRRWMVVDGSWSMINSVDPDSIQQNQKTCDVDYKTANSISRSPGIDTLW